MASAASAMDIEDLGSAAKAAANAATPAPPRASAPPAVGGSSSQPVGAGNPLLTVGRIHSMESLSTVDGPGNRFMVFLQGCRLRCIYCQNPDSWNASSCAGKKMTVEEIIAKVKRCLPYLRPNRGGITVSGGDPMLQPEFVRDLFTEIKKLGVTTCLDTSGIGTSKDAWNHVLPVCDLVMYCPKAFNPETFRKVTRTDARVATTSAEFAEEMMKRNVPMQVRYVILRDHTDTEEEVEHMVQFCKKHRYPGPRAPPIRGRRRPRRSHLAAIEILPYHTLGVNKYKVLGIPYSDALEVPPKEKIQAIVQRLKAEGFPVLVP